MVSAGWSHACALSATGAATCWGDNFYGELGNADWNDVENPSPVAVSGGLSCSVISAGSRSTCAVASTGAYCWGSAIFGATGNQIQAFKVLAPSKAATPQ